MENNRKWWASSANAQELSLTIRGLLVGVIPLVSIALDVPESLLVEIIEASTLFVSSAMVFLGLVRKIIVSAKQ